MVAETRPRTGAQLHDPKLAHHGSRNGTDARWLQIVRPELAVASLGKNNEYGHPHSETISLLRRAGMPLLRTDQLGTITITSDGRTWQVAEPSLADGGHPTQADIDRVATSTDDNLTPANDSQPHALRTPICLAIKKEHKRMREVDGCTDLMNRTIYYSPVHSVIARKHRTDGHERAGNRIGHTPHPVHIEGSERRRPRLRVGSIRIGAHRRSARRRLGHGVHRPGAAARARYRGSFVPAVEPASSMRRGTADEGHGRIGGGISDRAACDHIIGRPAVGHTVGRPAAASAPEPTWIVRPVPLAVVTPAARLGTPVILPGLKLEIPWVPVM